MLWKRQARCVSLLPALLTTFPFKTTTNNLKHQCLRNVAVGGWGGPGPSHSASYTPSLTPFRLCLPVGRCSLTWASVNTRWTLQFKNCTAAFESVCPVSVVSVSSWASVVERCLSDLCFQQSRFCWLCPSGAGQGSGLNFLHMCRS